MAITTRRVFATDKKFGIKRSLVCWRSRYGTFRYGVIIVACVIRQIRSRDYGGVAPFTYDLAALQLKNTRQHTWGSLGFMSECSWQLTYDLLESASEARAR